MDTAQQRDAVITHARDAGARIYLEGDFDGSGKLKKATEDESANIVNKVLGNAFNEVEAIEHLGASGDEIDASWSSIKELDTTERLYLGGAKVTDDHLAEIGSLKNVRFLALEYTLVSDQGLIHLSKLPRLEELSLRDPKITDEGVQHLAKLTSLRRLDITGTKITEHKLRELGEALPMCEITREY